VIPVYDHHAHVVDFVERGIWGVPGKFAECASIGFADETGLVAGLIYHNYEPEHGTIELSSFSLHRRWTTKEFIRMIFEYPFDQLGVRACVARHSEKNTRAVRIWDAFGAEHTRIPHLRGENEAEMVAVLTRSAWQNSKFMRPENGKRKRQRAKSA